ncbi:DUF177 domain-containing protein [Ferrovibrio sp.]|uniref:YceD family protein n=1 Tax=Ferrovibrio sp. TaxID=1917215 RepID=UPI00311D6225
MTATGPEVRVVTRESLPVEFSHVVETGQLPPEGANLDLIATEAERTALARRFQILAVHRLEAHVQVVLHPVVAGNFLVKGRFEADVDQACVVSLEPVREAVSESFSRSFAPTIPAGGARTGTDEPEWLDPDSADPPDLLADGRIDVGEVVAEELALGLDPYPRKAGADMPEQYRPKPDDEEGKISPFAALARLKAEKKD